MTRHILREHLRKLFVEECIKKNENLGDLYDMGLGKYVEWYLKEKQKPLNADSGPAQPLRDQREEGWNTQELSPVLDASPEINIQDDHGFDGPLVSDDKRKIAAPVPTQERDLHEDVLFGVDIESEQKEGRRRGE